MSHVSKELYTQRWAFEEYKRRVESFPLGPVRPFLKTVGLHLVSHLVSHPSLTPSKGVKVVSICDQVVGDVIGVQKSAYNSYLMHLSLPTVLSLCTAKGISPLPFSLKAGVLKMNPSVCASPAFRALLPSLATTPPSPAETLSPGPVL
ncbi:hypothetical protein KIPB_013711, partial [Kipferlia bialata]|eukprot:g13711.t1